MRRARVGILARVGLGGAGAATVAAAIALVAVGRGCDQAAPICGNLKVETGEQCDNGDLNGTVDNNCNDECKSISILIPQVNLRWELLHDTGVPGYGGSGCTDVGATKARVILSGPTPADEILECSRYSKLYAKLCALGVDADQGTCPHLLPGTYQATVTLLRDDGTPVTRAVTTERADVQPGVPVPLTVSYGQADFIKQDYTGTFYFHASWGQKDVGCAAATPPVTAESITLVKEGSATPVMGKVALPHMTKLDGTPGKCFTADNIVDTHEQVDELPWGKYSLTVRSGDRAYDGTWPIFVGPGKFGPTFEVIVPKPTPADAGTPSDGGTGDGG